MSFPLPDDDGYFAQQRREQQQAAQPQLLLMPPAADLSAPPPVHVDALPYVDEEYNDPDIKARVHALITQEMQQSTATPTRYAASLHTLPALAALPSLQPAYASPAATLAPLSTRHLTASFPAPPAPLPPPSRPPSPPPAAAATAAQLTAHLQWQQAAEQRWQLLRHYGPQQSTLLTQALKRRKADVEAELRREADDVEAVNRARRERQVEVGERLRWLDGEWWRLVSNVAGMRQRMNEAAEESTQTKRMKAASVS